MTTSSVPVVRVRASGSSSTAATPTRTAANVAPTSLRRYRPAREHERSEDEESRDAPLEYRREGAGGLVCDAVFCGSRDGSCGRGILAQDGRIITVDQSASRPDDADLIDLPCERSLFMTAAASRAGGGVPTLSGHLAANAVLSGRGLSARLGRLSRRFSAFR